MLENGKSLGEIQGNYTCGKSVFFMKICSAPFLENQHESVPWAEFGPIWEISCEGVITGAPNNAEHMLQIVTAYACLVYMCLWFCNWKRSCGADGARMQQKQKEKMMAAIEDESSDDEEEQLALGKGSLTTC